MYVRRLKRSSENLTERNERGKNRIEKKKNGLDKNRHDQNGRCEKTMTEED